MKIEESALCGDMRRQFDLCELDMLADENQSNTFETHFHDCSSCRNWLANWELVKLGAHKIGDLDVPESVFNNIMTLIEPAPHFAPSSALQAGFFGNELLMSGVGFGILLLALTVLASASLEESISWSFSFILLIAFNHLTKAKSAKHLLGAT